MQGDEKADLRHNLKQRNIERNKKKYPKSIIEGRWRNGIPICEKELFELELLALIMTRRGEDLSPIFASISTNHPFLLPQM